MVDQPGKGYAIASLVFGTISFVLPSPSTVLGILLSVGCGIAGIVCSANAKRAGYVGGMRVAGLFCRLSESV